MPGSLWCTHAPIPVPMSPDAPACVPVLYFCPHVPSPCPCTQLPQPTSLCLTLSPCLDPCVPSCPSLCSGVPSCPSLGPCVPKCPSLCPQMPHSVSPHAPAHVSTSPSALGCVPMSLCHDPILMPKVLVPKHPCPPVPADGLYLLCPRCEAQSPGSRGGGLGPRLPRASVSLCHQAPTCACVPKVGTLPLPASPPWGPHREATAPPELQARSMLGHKRHQKSRRPHGAAISPGVPRETPLVLTAALRYSAERPFPGGPRPTDVPSPPQTLSHVAGPP